VILGESTDNWRGLVADDVQPCIVCCSMLVQHVTLHSLFCSGHNNINSGFDCLCNGLGFVEVDLMLSTLSVTVLWIEGVGEVSLLVCRRGHDDLGDHYLDMGDLANALKCYSRARDYCTTARHLVNMCLNVIKVLCSLLARWRVLTHSLDYLIYDMCEETIQLDVSLCLDPAITQLPQHACMGLWSLNRCV